MSTHSHSPTRGAKRKRSPSPPSNPPSPPRTAPAPNIDSSGAFVWRKKLEQSRKRGQPATPSSEAARRHALREELAAAKRRRAEREAERAASDAAHASAERAREQASAGAGRSQAASFDGTQHFARQAIRLRSGRPTGSDELARFARLDVASTDFRLERTADVAALVRAALAEAPGDAADAVEYELDFVPDFPVDNDGPGFDRSIRLKYWTAVRDALKALTEVQRTPVSDLVRPELDGMLVGKTIPALKELRGEIERGLTGADPTFGDSDFWTAALARVQARIAEQEVVTIAQDLADERHERRVRVGTTGKDEANGQVTHEQGTAKAEEDMVREERAKGMGDGEAMFADEVQAVTGKGRQHERERPVDGFAWGDRLRPRKPRYFNRVHTGYNWTKYNRTHYDHDNPPPKTVQGYKFNIFYPDLLDPTRTPTFSLDSTDNPDVQIITFRAGPPYLPLAFKIVSRPWERSHKRGYRCSFDRGVLQLWFHFRRYRYRR